MVPSVSLGEQLVRAIIHFPKYLIEFVGGFILSILTDLDLTILTLFGVAVGFLTQSVWWALVLFFGLYVTLRAVGGISDAIRDLASATYRLANRA